MVPVFLCLEHMQQKQKKAVLPRVFHQIPMTELHQGFATFSGSIIQTDLYFPF